MPFCFLTVTPWVLGGDIANCAIILLALYSSIILSFLGGISWGWSDNSYSQNLNLIYGICFSLFSFLILVSAFFNSLLSLSLSFIGFNAFYYFESKRDILFDQKIELDVKSSRFSKSNPYKDSLNKLYDKMILEIEKS